MHCGRVCTACCCESPECDFCLLRIRPTYSINIFRCPDLLSSWQHGFMTLCPAHFLFPLLRPFEPFPLSLILSRNLGQHQSFSFVSSWILPSGPAISQMKLLAGSFGEYFVLSFLQHSEKDSSLELMRKEFRRKKRLCSRIELFLPCLLPLQRCLFMSKCLSSEPHPTRKLCTVAKASKPLTHW